MNVESSDTGALRHCKKEEKTAEDSNKTQITLPPERKSPV